MPTCQVTNPRTSKERVDAKLNGKQVLVNVGEKLALDLTGDQVGYLREKFPFLEVDNPEEKAKPPKDSKKARLLAADKDYSGPKPFEARKEA